MDVKTLRNFVKDFYGYKIDLYSVSYEKNEVGGLLYESFWLKCSCNNEENKFEAGLCYGHFKYMITKLLGNVCTSTIDKEKMEEILKNIDDYCRLRLPDKFLEEHYKAYVLSQYEDCEM